MGSIHSYRQLQIKNHKMDRLPRSGSHRPPSPAGKQHLPRLVRCNSQNPPPSPPASTQSNTKFRSRSTTKSRTYKDAEVNNFMIHVDKNIPMTVNTKKKPTQDIKRKPTSPSAWALSPGRPSPCSMAVTSAKSPHPGGGGGGGISGVLKYFRPKKVASEKEADRQCFKLMNNRLLQWRFANARAQTTMSTVQIVAEKKVFNAWIKILAIRNSNMVKRKEVQKLKNDIKVCHIMNSQLFLLEKWSRLEAKNFEAVGRVVRKLSVASVNIPLVDDSKFFLHCHLKEYIFQPVCVSLHIKNIFFKVFLACSIHLNNMQGDVLAVCDVLDNATQLLVDIESTITKLYYQASISFEAENSCYLMTELSIITKQEKESLTELQKWMLVVASLKQEKERSLRAHVIQGK
ncbi:hypothetical protein OSB04_025950 [Centaurea solstitialis]|uniref:QWRF motif-containing protein 7 n=1 Tax=Centaurea solstitialis TaxID=347529 RepID=A0AA38SWL0_9ASTR|nr:hypothetical protein OSB04_025950 [Centaurea solstitialis]